MVQLLGITSPPEASCGLVFVVFATRNVATIDITGIWGDNVRLTLIPKNTGEPDDYAAGLFNLGARFTFTSKDGWISAEQTISGLASCPAASG